MERNLRLYKKQRLCSPTLLVPCFVPKRRLRHAVDRVLMRRRIREAFRLHHAEYPMPEGARTDVAFVYVGSKPEPYETVERAMHKLLSKLSS